MWTFPKSEHNTRYFVIQVVKLTLLKWWECTIDNHLQGYVVACETAFYLVMHQFKNEERDGSKWALKFDDEIRYLAKENNVFRSQTHTMIHTTCRLCELEIR